MGLLNRGGDKKAPKKKADGGKKKKKRSSGGGGGMENAKKWLMLNVEKLVLGLIGLSAMFLIYKGLSGTGLPPNNGPTQLQGKLRDASSKLLPGNRDALRELRYPEADTFDQQAMKDTTAVDAGSYAITQPFFRIMDEQQRLRQDPELLKPVDILVRSGYGPLMLKEEAGLLDSFARDDNVRALTENLTTKWSLRGGGKAVPAFFNSIIGIIPLREQLENYNTAFIGAAEYEVDRDFPRYSGLRIERREVGTQEWTALDAMKNITIGPERWSGIAESDIVASKYYSPDFVKLVVMEIPPIAGADMDAFVSHPRLQTEAEADKQADQEEQVRVENEKANELAAKASGNTSGGHTAGGTESMTEEEIAFSKLAATGDIGMFRYFDFEVEPGKSYEYRVKLVLEDPNNPNSDSGVKPSQGALDPTVLVRLSDAVSSESLSTRETEWTDPTRPVRVPQPGRALVSTTTAGSTIGRSQIPALGDSGEPKAKVVAIGFDINNGYVVPVEMEVVRGMVLNSEQDTEVIDPSQNRLIELENYSNTTNIIVVDIAGGKVVGGGRRDEVRSPGKVLMVAPDGSFIVSDEMADAEDYASSIVLPNEEKAPAVREPPTEPEQRNRRGGRNGRGGRGGGPRGNEERAL